MSGTNAASLVDVLSFLGRCRNTIRATPLKQMSVVLLQYLMAALLLQQFALTGFFSWHSRHGLAAHLLPAPESAPSSNTEKGSKFQHRRHR